MKRKTSSLLWHALVFAIAMLFGAGPMLAQNALPKEKTTIAKPAVMAPNAQSAEPTGRAGGPQEGIKVHGHWVIEVRNPDSSLVTRREFNNVLNDGGKAFLAQWLSRSYTPARWSIELGVYSLTSPCNGGTAALFNNCYIIDMNASPKPTGTGVFPTLTAQIGGANSNQVILSGNATALVDGQIEFVATRQDSCSGNVAPSDCNTPGRTLTFSTTDLRDAQGHPTPLSVAQGRIVQVTVIFSFS